MVRVSVELVRKRAEHHDRQLAPLQEISLHQEGIEKIEHIQNWCPKLQILLLQSNLIPKIENLHKLKDLQYLNLAINNIEKVENLEKCESLQKLDLTLNFIGDLTSLNSLKNNYNLRHLYLNGNPCADYTGYREYTIAVLRQLETLDNEEITISERILAIQNFRENEKGIIKQQEKYFETRAKQKCRLEKEINEKWRNTDINLDDEEQCKKFWNEKTEHAPEVRVEMERFSKTRQQPKQEEKKPKEWKFFTDDGRPFNINEAKIPFKFNDEKDDVYILELHIYKHLDTSYLDVDIQPNYVRVKIKKNIFQIHLPEEINISESDAKRSQTTGYLIITLPKHNKTIQKTTCNALENVKPKEKRKIDKPVDVENNGKRELLEIGPPRNILKICHNDKIDSLEPKDYLKEKNKFTIKVKEPSADFLDDPDVPPLI